ncbi:TlpA family protein disulfide reductase [Alicyclobacillus sp. ALC3]|nr:redoxin family protein [Alicyclobacillus sp. ALC3]WDL96792.1 redoxin domain-containing protein [Alicyclobacillus sp. ALC3]
MQQFLGQRLPDIALTKLDGHEFHLSELAGKRHLIFMWASW